MRDREAVQLVRPTASAPLTAINERVVPLLLETAERITVVHVASGDLWAGAEVQLFHLACALDADPQVRLFVVLLNPGLLAQRLQERGVSVEVFDESRRNPLQILGEVHRFFRQVRPDIVHTHREKENVIGGLAARLVGARSVRTVHGLGEHSPRRWQLRRRLYRSLDRWCARHLQQGAVAVSHALAETLRTSLPKEKIHVVENGLDVDGLRRGAPAPVALPGRPHAVRIALAARLVPVKRVDVFLAIAEILAGRHPGEFEFYVFGDGPLMEETRRDIARRGLGGQVFLMGFKDPIRPYLARMDMLFITSDHEGLPMNLLEALSLGLPVVAHAVGGIPRALDGGRCGTLVSQEPGDYAAAARAYRENRAPFIEKARRGLALVRARYGMATNAGAYKALYTALHQAEKVPVSRRSYQNPSPPGKDS